MSDSPTNAMLIGPASQALLRERTKDLFVLTQRFYSAEQIEQAAETAIGLISRVGFGPDDKDDLGQSMDDVLQTTLMIAALRLPHLFEIAGPDPVTAHKVVLCPDCREARNDGEPHDCVYNNTTGGNA